MRIIRTGLLLSGLLLVGLLAVIQPAGAQEVETEPATEPATVPTYVPLASETNVRPGQLVALFESGYYLTQREYDGQLFGVAVAPDATAEEGMIPVVHRGTATVLVSTAGGAIAIGDLLTSSPTTGIAMKATRRGAVIGIALSPFSGSGEEGILAAISPHYSLTSGREEASVTPVRSWYDLSASAIAASPVIALRFTIAAIIFYIALSLALFTTIKGIRTGIAAIGRNPLAKSAILAGLTLNVGLTALIIGIGWWAGYLVLTSEF